VTGVTEQRPFPPRDIFVIRLQRDGDGSSAFRAEIRRVPNTAVTHIQTLGELVDYFQAHLATDEESPTPGGLR